MEGWIDKLRELIYTEKVGSVVLDFNVAQNSIHIKRVVQHTLFEKDYPIDTDKSGVYNEKN